MSQNAQVGTTVSVGNLDAAAAATNSASLPPPAPLPQNTMNALGAPAAPPPGGPAPVAPPMPPPPAAPAPGDSLPPPPPPSPADAAGAPLMSLPSLPTAGPAPVAPAVAPGTTVVAPVVPALTPVPSDVPPVVLPTPPAPGPKVVEPAKEIAPTDSAPLVSTASGGPLPPTYPRWETLALQRHPIPRVTPDSPLIPGPSLAETENQKRQITTLPGSGGDTNDAYATLGGPDGPPKPWVTPPSVVATKVGSDIGKDYPPLQAVMPRPQATPLRWDEPGSAFGTPSPTQSLNYYVSKTLLKNPDDSAINPAPTLAEVIVLRGGQEFQGLILERGDMWRIELLNGTIINVPGNKVAHVRKLLAAPTHTPGNTRSMVFPPQELYREQQTD